jgi:hypothetical protein
MNKLISVSAISLLLAGWAGGLAAQTITNGYVCAPKNPGGEETRLYFRQQDGVAVNLASSATFPVVCPVEIPYGEDFYDVVVRVGNGNDSTQKFSCALEEYDLGNNLVRSIGKALNLPAYTVGPIAWAGVVLLSESNYLSARCILPPRGQVGLVGWY